MYFFCIALCIASQSKQQSPADESRRNCQNVMNNESLDPMNVFNILAVQHTGNIPKNLRSRQLLSSLSLVDKFDFRHW